jgi:hypothetical protein
MKPKKAACITKLAAIALTISAMTNDLCRGKNMKTMDARGEERAALIDRGGRIILINQSKLTG